MNSTKLTRLVQSLCQMLKHHHCLIIELMTTSHHHHRHYLIMVMPAERGGNRWWCLNLDSTHPLTFRLLTSSSRKIKTTPVTEWTAKCPISRFVSTKSRKGTRWDSFTKRGGQNAAGTASGGEEKTETCAPTHKKRTPSKPSGKCGFKPKPCDWPRGQPRKRRGAGDGKGKSWWERKTTYSSTLRESGLDQKLQHIKPGPFSTWQASRK